MKFRLKAQAFIEMRLLEPDTIVEPEGYTLPGSERREGWAFFADEGKKVLALVPGLEWEPLDAEAHEAYQAKFPNGFIPPLEELQLSPKVKPKLTSAPNAPVSAQPRGTPFTSAPAQRQAVR